MDNLYLEQSILTRQEYDEWYLIVRSFLLSDEFQKRKLMKHHEKSVWNHCILVSLQSFKYGKKYHCDISVCTIAGLMHDFYPRAWQYSDELLELGEEYLPIKKKPFLKKHGFVHGVEASINYCKFYPNMINTKIINSIKRHMFPLTVIPPRYKEGWVVTLADKKISIKEINFKKDLFRYLGFK